MNEKVSKQRPLAKRRDEAAVYVLGKSLPAIDMFLAGEREVNDDGENEGGLEKKNGRMKAFISEGG